MNTPFRLRHNAFKLALATAVAVGGALTCNTVLAVNATTTAVVVTPVTVAVGTNLDFGRFAALTGGTLLLSTDSTRDVTGTVFLMSGGTPAAAKFDVTGDGSSTYTITVANSTLKHTNNTDSMAFAPFTQITASTSASGTSATTGALTTGAQSFYVGGILTVGTGQLAGTYSGTITATVAYN